MKKSELNKLLTDGGTLAAAPGVVLHRYFTDAMQLPCDVLRATFPPIPGTPGGASYTIAARDYDGIIAELADVIEKHYTRAARTLSENVKNGYSGGR